MSRRFHASAQIDEDRRRIIFVMTGEIDTRILIDRWIATYSEIAEPWLYDRLFDYRRADGIVDFDELVRFADWWQDRVHGVDYSSRVAIVVNNPLDAARVAVVSNLFPRDIRLAFTTLDEALEWLDKAPARTRT